MNTKNVDKAYTEVINEMLTKGYRFCTLPIGGDEWGSTKSGSYSIKTKTCLTNGKKFVEVCVAEIRSRTHKFHHRKSILVAESLNPKKPDFFPIEKCKRKCVATLYGIGRRLADNYYCPKEEAERADAITAKRTKERYARFDETIYEFGDNAKKVVMPYIKRQRGFKRITLENIARVFKSYSATENGEIDGTCAPAYYVKVVRNGEATMFHLNLR